MSKFEQIEAFITVAEEASFSAAAKKLGVSTAAISRQISQLEVSLGVALLARTTRQVTLTAIGSEYYRHCKAALGTLDEAETAIQQSHSDATGKLTVTCSRYFAMQYVIPRLADFMQENPKLQIKLELAERVPNLAKEDIDIVFGISLEGPPNWVRKRVATTRYILCASPDYLKKHGMPEVPSDLKKHAYITHSMRVPGDVVTFKNNLEVFVEPILRLNDSYAMRQCALQGMGIIKLHDYVVADDLNAGRLQEVLPDYQDTQISVYLYYLQNRFLQPKIRRFVDFYTEKF